MTSSVPSCNLSFVLHDRLVWTPTDLSYPRVRRKISEVFPQSVSRWKAKARGRIAAVAGGCIVVPGRVPHIFGTKQAAPLPVFMYYFSVMMFRSQQAKLLSSFGPRDDTNKKVCFVLNELLAEFDTSTIPTTDYYTTIRPAIHTGRYRSIHRDKCSQPHKIPVTSLSLCYGIPGRLIRQRD